MKNFKHYLYSDIPNVFVNIEEHGDVAQINGVSINLVWDGDTLEYKIKKDYPGLILGDVLFFISVDEWEKVPKVSHPPKSDEAILIDGRHATITNVKENAGLYEITIAYSGTGRAYAY